MALPNGKTDYQKWKYAGTIQKSSNSFVKTVFLDMSFFIQINRLDLRRGWPEGPLGLGWPLTFLR